METLLPAIIGPAVGGVLCLVILWRTIPGILKDHKEQITQLVTVFREDVKAHADQVEKIVSRLQSVETGILTIQQHLLAQSERRDAQNFVTSTVSAIPPK